MVLIPDVGMTFVAMKLQVSKRCVPVLVGVPGLVFAVTHVGLVLLPSRVMLPEVSVLMVVLG